MTGQPAVGQLADGRRFADAVDADNHDHVGSVGGIDCQWPGAGSQSFYHQSAQLAQQGVAVGQFAPAHAGRQVFDQLLRRADADVGTQQQDFQFVEPIGIDLRLTEKQVRQPPAELLPRACQTGEESAARRLALGSGGRFGRSGRFVCRVWRGGFGRCCIESLRRNCALLRVVSGEARCCRLDFARVGTGRVGFSGAATPAGEESGFAGGWVGVGIHRSRMGLAGTGRSWLEPGRKSNFGCRIGCRYPITVDWRQGEWS